MARRTKRKYSRKRGMKIPIAVVAGFTPLAINTFAWVRDMGWQTGFGMAASTITGYNFATGKWSMENLKFGALPMIIGVIVSKLATKLGINAKLARTGLPIRV